MKHQDPETNEPLRRIPRGEDHAGYLENERTGDRFYLRKGHHDLPKDQKLAKVRREMPDDERARRTIKPKTNTRKAIASARNRIIERYEKAAARVVKAMARELAML
jgi:hypothetical protein